MGNYDLLIKAIRHYANTFKQIQNDDEIANDVINQDLISNANKLEKIADELQRMKSPNSIHDYMEWIDSAVLSYKNDLEDKKARLIKKMGKNMVFTLENTNSEIQECEAYLKSETNQLMRMKL